MIFEPQVFDYIEGDQAVLEEDILERLTAEGQVRAYRHTDFWQCMDALRDKQLTGLKTAAEHRAALFSLGRQKTLCSCIPKL